MKLTRSLPFPTATLPQHLLTSLHRWILCIAIVHFDLDVGPDLDNIYPPTVFSPEEQAAIAFSSFPDTTPHTSTGNTSQTFSWRIRRSPDRPSASPLTADAPALSGYCYFVQTKDEACQRGYIQQSLAIITHHSEYVGFFSSLMNVLGPMYNSAQDKCKVIQAAILDVAQWQALEPPANLALPFLGTTQTIDFPQLNHFQAHHALVPTSKISSKFDSITARIPSNILASNPIPPLSWIFRDNIPRLWLLWELVILAEPILIFAPGDPSRASAFVHWTRSLIRPIPSAGEWRPYFHVHSPDFTILANTLKPPPGVILGCTNPLILSACRQWPHIIRLSISTSQDDSISSASHFSSNKTQSSHSYRAAQESHNGLFSERVRHIRRDPQVVEAVSSAIKRGDFFAADAMLIESFAQLTQRFLGPLERYFTTLLPPPHATDFTFNPKFTTKPFNQVHFLEHLRAERRAAGSESIHLPLRRSRITAKTQSVTNFYERFLKSGNFALWLDDRTHSMTSAYRKRYIQKLKENDMPTNNDNEDNCTIESIQQRQPIIDSVPQLEPAGADIANNNNKFNSRSSKRDSFTNLGVRPSSIIPIYTRHRSSASKSTIDFGANSSNTRAHSSITSPSSSAQGFPPAVTKITKLWSTQTEKLKSFRRPSEDLSTNTNTSKSSYSHSRSSSASRWSANVPRQTPTRAFSSASTPVSH